MASNVNISFGGHRQSDMAGFFGIIGKVAGMCEQYGKVFLYSDGMVWSMGQCGMVGIVDGMAW